MYSGTKYCSKWDPKTHYGQGCFGDKDHAKVRGRFMVNTWPNWESLGGGMICNGIRCWSYVEVVIVCECYLEKRWLRQAFSICLIVHFLNED